MKITINKKRAAILALPCFCWLALGATACSGDDDDASSGGSAGTSAGKNAGGSAGKPAGGSANGGGTDGGGTHPGTAGSAGTGGSSGGEPPVIVEGGAGGQGPVGMAGSGMTPVAGAGGSESAEGGSGGQDALGGQGGSGGEPAVVDAVPYLFDISPTGHDRFYNSTFDAAGNLYAVGQITSSNDATADIASLVAKFTPAGKLDTTFGNKGVFVRNLGNGTNGELLRSIVVQSTGKVLAYGTVEHGGVGDARDRDAVLIRLNADGSKDTTFGTDGILRLDFSLGAVTPTNTYVADSGWGLAKYPGNDDRIVISGGKVRDGGTDTNFVLMRLSADGVPDETFGTHGLVELDTAVTGVDHNNASARNVTILPGTDGVVGAGYQPKPGADTSPVVWKVSNTGVIDDAFADHGVYHASLLDHQTEAYSAVVQPKVGGGYNLVTTGYGRALSTETTDLVSVRLTSGGAVDESYGDHGLVRVDIGGFGDNSRNLLVLPDRRVVLVGGGRLTSADVDAAVAVLLPDGAPDTTWGPDGYKLFNLGGPADFFWGVALSPDQKTLGIAGIKGVGNAPVPAYAADDSAVFWLPVP